MITEVTRKQRLVILLSRGVVNLDAVSQSGSVEMEFSRRRLKVNSWEGAKKQRGALKRSSSLSLIEFSVLDTVTVFDFVRQFSRQDDRKSEKRRSLAPIVGGIQRCLAPGAMARFRGRCWL